LGLFCIKLFEKTSFMNVKSKYQKAKMWNPDFVGIASIFMNEKIKMQKAKIWNPCQAGMGDFLAHHFLVA